MYVRDVDDMGSLKRNSLDRSGVNAHGFLKIDTPSFHQKA